MTMSKLQALLCCLLLIATVVGLAHSDRSFHIEQMDGVHSNFFVQEARCSEGTGHVSCQFVLTEEVTHLELHANAGSLPFVTKAVSDSGRTIGPHTPPPRDLS
jgi:hypothetical protein